MSLINKKLIERNKFNHNLLNFFLEDTDFEYLTSQINNFIRLIFPEEINFSEEQCKILLNCINVFNLFLWADTKNGEKYWKIIDKKQCDYLKSNYIDFFKNRNIYTIIEETINIYNFEERLKEFKRIINQYYGLSN